MREERIQKALEVLGASQIEIINESHMHSGPRTDSHYKLLIVAECFKAESRVQRQRKVNSLLKAEFDAGMHALSLRCLTPNEAKESGLEFQSPDCASSNRPTES